jgi:hypothetical protein
MKYLITESKLDSVILQYLDNQDFVIYNNRKKRNNYIYFLNSDSDRMSQISVYVNNAFGVVKNWVFVNYDLIEELSDFFSIDKLDCLDIIRLWVIDTLGIKVNKIMDSSGEHYHRLIVVTE